MYLNQAYLLDIDGNVLPVENHPSIHIESDFEDICKILESYGSDNARNLVESYKSSGNHKEDILQYYCQNWCKVRTWGTFYEEVTFRITSKGLNWYNTILQFLLDHEEYKRSLISVESDRIEGPRKVYWDKLSYDEAVDPKNEEILASKLPNYNQIVVL